MGSENRICGQTKYTILNYSNYLNKKKNCKVQFFLYQVFFLRLESELLSQEPVYANVRLLFALNRQT